MRTHAQTLTHMHTQTHVLINALYCNFVVNTFGTRPTTPGSGINCAQSVTESRYPLLFSLWNWTMLYFNHQQQQQKWNGAWWFCELVFYRPSHVSTCWLQYIVKDVLVSPRLYVCPSSLTENKRSHDIQWNASYAKKMSAEYVDLL